MRFEKVSLEAFTKSLRTHFPDLCYTNSEITMMWKDIKLPKRATSGSAGYDFFSPVSFVHPRIHADGKPMPTVVPTGIKVVGMPKSAFLMIVPKSGIGFRTGVALSNTVGIVDSDYEGQILVKFEVGRKELEADAGDKFVQGIIMQYLVVEDDEPGDAARGSGGFGSTGVR